MERKQQEAREPVAIAMRISLQSQRKMTIRSQFSLSLSSSQSPATDCLLQPAACVLPTGFRLTNKFEPCITVEYTHAQHKCSDAGSVGGWFERQLFPIVLWS